MTGTRNAVSVTRRDGDEPSYDVYMSEAATAVIAVALQHAGERYSDPDVEERVRPTAFPDDPLAEMEWREIRGQLDDLAPSAQLSAADPLLHSAAQREPYSATLDLDSRVGLVRALNAARMLLAAEAGLLTCGIEPKPTPHGVDRGALADALGLVISAFDIADVGDVPSG